MTHYEAAVPHEEYLKELLQDPEQAAAYINVAIEENDPQLFLTALHNVALARGINHVAEAANMKRESVSRMLSKSGNPALSNLLKLLDVSGLVLQVKAK